METTNARIGYYNGEFCEASQIAVNVDSIGLNRGYAAFDFMKVVNRKPFYPERHIARFMNTMKQLRIQIKDTPEELLSIINAVAKKNQGASFGLKLFATPIEPCDIEILKAEFSVLPSELPVYPDEMYTCGSKLIMREHQRFLPEAKSTNYLPSVLWQYDMAKEGAIEILYHFNNQISEASRSNIFIVKNNAVYTPVGNVLRGITRSIVIDLIHEQQISFSEREITVDELMSADEVFITSTTKGVAPIVGIEANTISNGLVGTISKQLIDLYNQLLL